MAMVQSPRRRLDVGRQIQEKKDEPRRTRRHGAAFARALRRAKEENGFRLLFLPIQTGERMAADRSALSLSKGKRAGGIREPSCSPCLRLSAVALGRRRMSPAKRVVNSELLEMEGQQTNAKYCRYRANF